MDDYWQQRRDEFPALSGGELVYLDNAATTQIPECALDAVCGYYRAGAANPARGLYRISAAATDAFEQARAGFAGFVGAGAEEIAFLRNATEGLNLVAASWAARHLGPGDAVVVTAAEHHSNLLPWQRACLQTGATLRVVGLDAQGRLDEGALAQALDRSVKILAMPQVSNVLGTVFPVAKAVELAHSRGAAVVLDCAQSAGHIPIDLHGLGVDFAAFSGHKMYAPEGIGALYARESLMEEVQPFLLGGGMVDSVWQQRSNYLRDIRKLEAGTQNVGGAIGLAAAVAYLQDIGAEAIAEREKRLAEHLLRGLADLGCVEVYGITSAQADRAGIVSFNVRGVDPQDVAFFLDEHNICLRVGSHCAQPLLRLLGIETCCRASLSFYNTFEEIDLLCQALSTMQRHTSRRIMGMFP